MLTTGVTARIASTIPLLERVGALYTPALCMPLSFRESRISEARFPRTPLDGARGKPPGSSLGGPQKQQTSLQTLRPIEGLNPTGNPRSNL
jgi:hypothetical protein